MKFNKIDELRIAIIGLGYVGLPLAITFAEKFQVVGYDIEYKRISELKAHLDRTGEVGQKALSQANNLTFTNAKQDIATCNCFIVTVPTPIDSWNRPDMSALLAASSLVAEFISAGDLVIFESTVFPGATEEICAPAIAEQSGISLAQNDKDDPRKCFYIGYSPERINPGDQRRRLKDIVKVTSGSTTKAAALIDKLYASVIDAGTHLAPSIRVAEAAKVIENTQRDVNIALVNELAILFDKLSIDTEQVLQAAGTKWNFLPFRPGLVGGHCIGVDPYYLTHKAAEVGHHSEMILAGRRTNEGMSEHIANRVLRLMMARSIEIRTSRILVMGLTFKENCPDIRNSKVIDLISDLRTFTANVEVYDPNVDVKELPLDLANTMTQYPVFGGYDAIILAVAHDAFMDMGAKKIRTFGKSNSVLFDVKCVFESNDVDGRL